MAMLDRESLCQMGFASIGENVQISDRASFYGISRISLGSNVRIDDYCVLSAGEGGFEVGNFVHIAVFSSLIGKGKITLSDFCNVSSRVSIYSSNDDYSGATMTNPTVPEEFKGVTHSNVFLGRHVIVGCGSVVLPGVTIEEGAAIGALSLVHQSCEAFSIYAGNPLRCVGMRLKDLLMVEKEFLATRDS